jgi:glycerol-3-phosphate dehydrogenase
MGVLDIAWSDQRWMRRLPGSSAAIAAEIPFAIREEQALTLVDILARRPLAWKDDVGLSAVDVVAQAAAPVMGWTNRSATTRSGPTAGGLAVGGRSSTRFPAPHSKPMYTPETWRN